MSYVKDIRKFIGNRPLILTGGRVLMINEKGEILLHKRTDFVNTWSLPGGSSEIGETIGQTVLREVKEETGLIMLEFKPIGFSSKAQYEKFDYPNGDEVHLFAMVFLCTKWEGKLTCSVEESPEIRFFNLKDLPNIRLNERKAIEMYMQYLEKEEFVLEFD